LSSPQNTTAPTPQSSAGPSIFWLCVGFLLAGMGTILLGPILPALSQEWHLPDYQAGLLLFAKFLGAFVGGSTVPNKLRNGIFFGLLATCAGLSAFAYAGGLFTGSIALFVTGVGLGQLIASTNILAGRRYNKRTGSALSFINFFWSLGAVCIGLLVAALLPHHTLREFLLTFAIAFIVIALGGRLQSTHPDDSEVPSEETSTIILPRQIFICFCVMLFLYGGLETCLSQWITTFTKRYAGGHVLAGQSAIVVLWTALTLGRALSSLLLRRMRESTLQRGAMVCSALLVPVLAKCSSAKSLSITCVLLGLSLSPFFPSTFALLLRRRPPARVAGFILAVSGLGAASLTWLMGVISSQAGSLRVAMVVPFLAALGLLAASFWLPPLEAGSAVFPKLPKFQDHAKASN
jgi:FHS family glucose/mannose:H+ symporter-like MFS transporter